MNIEVYFNNVISNRQEAMRSLRKMIKEVLPNVVEDMGYNMPTYTFNEVKICALASQKNYMSLYIMNDDLLDNFKEELKLFNCGKSCIRFRKLDPETVDLLKEIITFIKRNISNSQFYKK